MGKSGWDVLDKASVAGSNGRNLPDKTKLCQMLYVLVDKKENIFQCLCCDKKTKVKQSGNSNLLSHLVTKTCFGAGNEKLVYEEYFHMLAAKEHERTNAGLITTYVRTASNVSSEAH